MLNTEVVAAPQQVFSVDIEALKSVEGVGPEAAAGVGFEDGAFGLTPRTHRTYNFEVEGTHTYIADGVRVHNTSVLSAYDDKDGVIVPGSFEFKDGRVVAFETVYDERAGVDAHIRHETDGRSDDGQSISVKKTISYTDTEGGEEILRLVQVSTHQKNDEGELVNTGARIVDVNLRGQEFGEDFIDWD